MRASDLIRQLTYLVSMHGDGPVCVPTLRCLPEVKQITMFVQKVPAPAFALLVEGRPLTEAEDTDQSIDEEIDDIGRDLRLTTEGE